jgi:hypothetical protein
VGGYSAKSFFSEGYKVELPMDADWSLVRPPLQGGRPNFGADWWGQTRALTRLILGFDEGPLNALIAMGVNQQIIEQWIGSGSPHMPLVFVGMPIQDAIDFAAWMANVVVGWFRFGIGMELCRGPIDIAIVTPDAFRWAQQKQWAIKGEKP